MNCPLCGAPARSGLSLPHTVVWSCADLRCGLRFAWPQLNDEELAAAYRRLYYPSSDGEKTGTYESTPPSILKQVFRELGKRAGDLYGKRLLDYGCGIGDLCRVALDYGMRPTGIEKDSSARAAAGRDGAITIYGGIEALQAREPDAGFDVVVLWQVIEHLREPWRDLSDLRRLMTDGGWLVVSTPNAACLKARLQRARWSNHQNPTHFYYFTRRSLRATLARANFSSIAVQNFHIRYPSHPAARRAVQGTIVPLGLGGELLFIARAENTLREEPLENACLQTEFLAAGNPPH